MIWLQKFTPGLLFVLLIAFISTWLGSLFPLIGGPVFGITLGIMINNIWGKPKNTLNGVQFSSKKILQWAIIALGCGLSLSKVWETGMESLGVMLISLLFAFAATYFFGRILKIPGRLKVLIGVGTGICGGSAIAAVSPVIEAEEVEIAYAVSTIFLFNIFAVLLFPSVGHWLGLSDKAFGIWAGTAINDTSSVVAAGYLYSNAAGDYAIIVKLARATLIIPITFVIAAYVGIRKKREASTKVEGEESAYSLLKIFPWFILWFLVAALFNTLGLFGETTVYYLGLIAKFLIIMALTGIGLSANFRKMLKTGIKPILLGLIVWIVVALVSLLILFITGDVIL
ncbi:YeiH family putative sulfate export transporter [Paenibacillus sp. S3N08]|uniref:YeiH family putative sulfate export transporter n=1 Tax=Paenibacillus agricola TaxID=2716264 RepID=A0ABX0J8C9_9BACL|nr:YeiH family putative sulfate export transporter [Paenibacillus agricola]